MKKVVVTGGSGKAGRATVRELLEHGYEVLNIDIAPPREAISRYLSVDLMQFGETAEALHGAEAVVHLAANPNPTGWTEERMFRHNTTTTYNIFRAATMLGLKRVVWASSETTLGLPFEREKPQYAPIDEQHPLNPESSYALSKVISEEMARQFSRWSGIPFVGLRFSNIMEPHNYQNFPDIQGAEAFIIAAADTVMNQPNRELMAAVYPNVPLRDGVGDFDTLLGIDKARRLLGYAPAFSWREHVG
jgi:nucleoside-diphosphate-sugar epimerase